MSSRASGRLSCRALSWVSFSSVPRVGTSNPLRSWSALRCRLARRVACLVGCLVGLCRGSSFPLVGTSNPLRSWSALRCHLMSSRASGRLSCRIVSAPGNLVGGLIASRPFLSHVDPHVGCLLRSRIRDAWSDARQGAHRSIDPSTQCVQGSVGPPTHCACGRIYPPTQCACRSIEPLTQYAHRFIDPPTQGAHWSIDPPTQCAERSMDPRTQCADRSIDPPTPTRLDPGMRGCASSHRSRDATPMDPSSLRLFLLLACLVGCFLVCRRKPNVGSSAGSLLSLPASGLMSASLSAPSLMSDVVSVSPLGRCVASAIVWCRLARRVACLVGCLVGPCRGVIFSSVPLVGTSNPLRSWSAVRYHLMSSRVSGRLSFRLSCRLSCLLSCRPVSDLSAVLSALQSRSSCRLSCRLRIWCRTSLPV